MSHIKKHEVFSLNHIATRIQDKEAWHAAVHGVTESGTTE